MSKLPYMPLYPADLLSNENAIALSMPAFGAWVKTFCIMWRAESGTLTKSLDQWGRAWGCSRRETPSTILAEIETVGTVTKNPDGTITIHSARVDAELARLQSKREKGKTRKERFESREESESRTHQERVPNAVRTHLDMNLISEYDSSLTPEEVKAEPQEKPRGDEISFSAWWDAYGHKIDRAKCLAKWKHLKAKDRELAMEHTARYVAVTHTDGTFPSRKNPLTYLNARSWLDEDLPAAQPIVAMNGHAHPAKRSCTNCGGALGSDHASHQGRPYCGPCYDRAPWLRAHSLQAA